MLMRYQAALRSDRVSGEAADHTCDDRPVQRVGWLNDLRPSHVIVTPAKTGVQGNHFVSSPGFPLSRE
jgi:hypothetical protein